MKTKTTNKGKLMKMGDNTEDTDLMFELLGWKDVIRRKRN